MKKKVCIFLVLVLVLINSTVFAAPIYEYKYYYKDISTTKTSSRDDFKSTIPYSDSQGYTGTYYKSGGSYVVSGQAPIGKFVTKTITSSTNDSTYFYNDGTYSGVLNASSSRQIEKTRVINGSAKASEGFIQECETSNPPYPNLKYDPDKFNYYDMGTWEYTQGYTKWGVPQSLGIDASSSGGFNVSFSGLTVTSATYPGAKSVSIAGPSVSTINNPVYALNPNNGYTPPFVGQKCLTKSVTYNYSLSASIPYNEYEITFTGYVSTQDTRVWKQEYSGTAVKVITDSYDASITTNLPSAMVTGEEKEIAITAKNTGTLDWTSQKVIKLKSSGSFPFENEFTLPEETIIKPGQSYTWKSNVKAPEVGEYNISMTMNKDGKDFGNALNKSIYVYDLLPIGGTLKVEKYDYYDGNNTFWTKSNSQVKIYSDGYFDTRTGLYPSENEVLYGNTSIISTINGTSSSGVDLEFTELQTSAKAIKKVSNNKNYLQSTQTFKIDPNAFDKKYNLLFRSNYEGNRGQVKDSGVILGIDNIAPDGEVDIENDLTALNVVLSDVVEEGSGIKRVWVEYTTDKNKTPVLRDMKSENDKYINTIPLNIFANNPDEELEYVKVEVKAIDNVGNERSISSELVEMFSVKATIERVLAPNAPIFRAGEKGIIKIELKGNVDKLKIKFSNKLSALNSNLDQEIKLDPKPSRIINHQFFVPLYAEDGEYAALITGYKGDKEKEARVKFQVQGSILDNLKKRIKK